MDEIKNDFSSSLVGVTQETITINYNRLLLGGSPGSLCGCEGWDGDSSPVDNNAENTSGNKILLTPARFDTCIGVWFCVLLRFRANM